MNHKILIVDFSAAAWRRLLSAKQCSPRISKRCIHRGVHFRFTETITLHFALLCAAHKTARDRRRSMGVVVRGSYGVGSVVFHFI